MNLEVLNEESNSQIMILGTLFVYNAIVLEREIPKLQGDCTFTCGFGICEENQCNCKDGYFGRTCSFKIYKTENEAFQTTESLEPYASLFYYDDITIGDPEVNYEIRSGDQPILLFVVNEASNYNTDIFFRQADKRERSDIGYYLMGELQQSGQQGSSFIGEKAHIYIRFTNYGSKNAHVDLRVSSKSPLN